MSRRLIQVGSHLSLPVAKMTTATNIHLYTTQTPNGIKVSILLEELGLAYQVTPPMSRSLGLMRANVLQTTKISLDNKTQKVRRLGCLTLAAWR